MGGPPTPEQQANQEKVSAANLVSTIKASDHAAELLHKNKLRTMEEDKMAQKVAAEKLITDLKTSQKADSILKPKKPKAK